MFRLMIHSELAYKNLCDFPKQTWYKVYYHEQLCNTMSNQDKWQLAEKKNVKIENAALD